MNSVFENIIEKLEEMIHPKQLYFCKYARGGCKHLDNDDKDCMECVVENAIEIVKQEAEKYNNGWIPCSERLPEDKQTCLVTARIYFTPDHVDEIDNYIGVEIDTYSKQFGWLGTEPIAWQPLPAPYQPKGE